MLVWPAVELAFGVMIVIALSLLGSVALSSTANGIGVFMLFGAGLVAGLLSSIGHGLNSHAIKHASTIAAWALPFEALYQDALRMITQDESGVTGFLIQLGPFGGAYVHGWPIRVWAVCYLVLVGAGRADRLLTAQPLAAFHVLMSTRAGMVDRDEPLLDDPGAKEKRQLGRCAARPSLSRTHVAVGPGIPGSTL